MINFLIDCLSETWLIIIFISGILTYANYSERKKDKEGKAHD